MTTSAASGLRRVAVVSTWGLVAHPAESATSPKVESLVRSSISDDDDSGVNP